MTIIRSADLEQKSIGPTRYATICGGPVMMLRVFIPPQTDLPAHQHENFQLGYVLAGSGTLIIGDEAHAVSQGDAYRIAENVPHALRTEAEALELLDMYYPPKEDRL